MLMVASLLKPDIWIVTTINSIFNSANMDKSVCNKLLVNSTEVPVIQRQ